ncbi:Lumazine-binding protein, partial [Catenaria anguillulae PL171]
GFTLIIGDAEAILADCHIGDSIAINGTCLTVTEFTPSTFKVGLIPETLRKTSLGELQVGDKVNLERAMSGGTRFGGHFVQGHVDCTCTINSVTPEGESLVYEFTLPADRADLMAYIIPKGYITLDGTSLTVVDVDDRRRAFSICMISHTQKCVVMPRKKVGSQVNVEVDMLGKYVERVSLAGMLEAYVERAVERALAKRLDQ